MSVPHHDWLVTRREFLAGCAVGLGAAALLPVWPAGGRAAQQPGAGVIPGADPEPFLRLETGGPLGHVTAVAFSPDGRTLYAAGLDKVVRLWTLNPRTGQFELEKYAFRVPIGPGTEGAINALALSPDGAWLAVGGYGVMRHGTGFRTPGRVYPALGTVDPEMWQDRGLIYLFSTRTMPTAVRILRGCAGEIITLTFAPAHPNKPPLLVTASREKDANDQDVGRLRVWDITRAARADEKGAAVEQQPEALVGVLEEWSMPDPLSKPRPGLAVRHTGDRPAAVRVAFAWGDGKLRVWDVDQAGRGRVKESFGPAPEKPEHVLYAGHTVAYLPNGRLLVGALSKRAADAPTEGWLYVWDDPDGRAPRFRDRRPLPAGAGQLFWPRAISLFAATPGGPVDHAALIVQTLTQDNTLKPIDYRVRLVKLDDLSVVARRSLWAGGADVLPCLAAASGSGHLAIAGNKEHAVFVLTIPDALAEKGQSQRLAGVGTPFLSVAFAAKEGQPGLLLREAAKDAPGRPVTIQAGDLVFDLINRTIVADAQQAGWRVVSPADNGWQVRHADPVVVDNPVRPAETDKVNRWTFTWQGPAGARGQVQLHSELAEELTDYALLPPVKPLEVPVLAVATWIAGLRLPMLRLYEARTGQQLREFRGHSEPIRCLAASPDGRILASASEDRTVSCWTLTDLEESWQKVGRLPGVVLKEDKQQVVIAQVDPSVPGNQQLAAGDVVVALVTKAGEKPVPISSALQFYNAFWHTESKPGAQVTLTIRRGGRQQDVQLPVGQGIDERKPLCCLCVTAPDEQGTRRWLGWSPFGYYDVSDRLAEEHLGWHFNTGTLTEPARFAEAKDYREKYYQRDLLRRLVEKGNLKDALAAGAREQPPIPPPRIVLTINGDPASAGQDVVRVDHPKVRLDITIEGPSCDKGEVAKVVWRLGDGAAQPVPLGRAQTLTQELVLPDRSGE